jgi:hypothetical protein
LVLQCAFSGTRNAAFNEIAPDFLRGSHALDFTDFDVGWHRLYESLYKAAILAGLYVPKLLRAAPRYDMDQAAVAQMVVEHGFFNNRINPSGGAEEAELTLAPGGLLVDDRSSLRTWIRGCVDPSVLPKAPPKTADEEAAIMTPPSRRTDQQRALVEARQNMALRMRVAIEQWTTRLNIARSGGYDDWRLPTLEEAMSLVSKNIRNDGLYISELFSDHPYIRTADRSPGPISKLLELFGEAERGWESTWVVGYADSNCGEVAEEAPIPLRFVRTDLD